MSSKTNVSIFPIKIFLILNLSFLLISQQTLIDACRAGKIDQARQLLRSGANVNFQDSVSDIAIM